MMKTRFAFLVCIALAMVSFLLFPAKQVRAQEPEPDHHIHGTQTYAINPSMYTATADGAVYHDSLLPHVLFLGVTLYVDDTVVYTNASRQHPDGIEITNDSIAPTTFHYDLSFASRMTSGTHTIRWVGTYATRTAIDVTGWNWDITQTVSAP